MHSAKFPFEIRLSSGISILDGMGARQIAQIVKARPNNPDVARDSRTNLTLVQSVVRPDGISCSTASKSFLMLQGILLLSIFFTPCLI